MRVRAGVAFAIASVVGACGLSGCNGGAGALSRSTAVTVESPTYLPADLPGGFGANPVTFTLRPRGYVLSAKAHETTYTVDVTTRRRGEVALTAKRLATLAMRTDLQPGGRIGWRDHVAQASISAVGPEGHTRRGLRTIGKRMVVVPRSVLDELVTAGRTRRNRQVELEPIEFPAAAVSVPQALYGRIGRTGINVTTPRERVGTGTCFGCEHAAWFTGWEQDGTTHTLIGAPPGTTIARVKGVKVERRFDPMAGSDLVLLSTERDDNPRVSVQVPGQEALRFAIAETTL